MKLSDAIFTVMFDDTHFVPGKITLSVATDGIVDVEFDSRTTDGEGFTPGEMVNLANMMDRMKDNTKTFWDAVNA